jgi:predicted RNase H-like HicB family nuclease
MLRTFTAVYAQEDDWWIGWIEELPGAIAQERTLEETRESLREVIPIILDVQREANQGREQLREELTITL